MILKVDAEELQEKLWGKQGEKNYLTIEFARAVLEYEQLLRYWVFE